jgi:hypothetical protein
VNYNLRPQAAELWGMVLGIIEVAGGEMDLNTIDQRWRLRVRELLTCLTPADIADIIDSSSSNSARFKRIARWAEEPIRNVTFDELFSGIFQERAS